MNRKTLLAGGVFAALLLVALVVLRAPEKGTRTGEAARPIPAIAEGALDTLEVTKDGKTTVIKKQGTTYKVTAPVDYPAETEASKQAFEAIEKLEFASIVSDQKARHGDYEVTDKALRVVAKKADKVLADLRLGKIANNLTMVRVEGKDEVWQAVGSLKWQFDKDAAGWRDKSIVTFTEADAERVEVAAKGGAKIVVARAAKTDGGAADEGWKVVEWTEKGASYDKAVAADLVSALSTLKANDFADGVSPADSGLDAPELVVTTTLKGGKTETLQIGKKKGEEDIYVKSAANPQVFLVKKVGLERVNKRPIEFRDKTICDLTDAEVTQVAVTRGADSYTLVKDPKKSGDDAWKLSKPAGTLDTSKVSSIVSAFKDWKAASFAEDNSAKATGTDKPAATVVATSNVKGRGCTLKIGNELADKQNTYVAVAGSPNVMLAPKWSLDRVLVKADDLKKK
ncbi:MAG TPA: DUF4340 domain-containing protein [Polyangia bacterium]